MIHGKLEGVVTIKEYDIDGKFIGEGVKYNYKPILLWRDVFAGVFIALLILSRFYV